MVGEVRSDMKGRAATFALSALLVAGCASMTKSKLDLDPEGEITLGVTSTAFPAGGTIPNENSAYGADRSPELQWSGVGGKAYAVIMHDPDAPGGDFTHWVIYNLPEGTTKLPADLPKVDHLPSLGGAKQGRNDHGGVGYFGPRPPAGPPHHYRFEVYALDSPLDVPPGASRGEVEQAMSGRVRAKGALVGLYQRSD